MQQPQHQHPQQQLDMSEALEADATAAGDRLAGLLAALGAVDEQQAADRHMEMVLRLRRLDQVGRVADWTRDGDDAWHEMQRGGFIVGVAHAVRTY